MKKSLVSVLINCYNGEKYIEKAINSVLIQTYQNLEIIFWDNKSVDNTSNIIKKLKDPRIKYFLAENHTSQYKARNLAIQKCNGEYIAFLDADDWWENDKLKKQIELHNNYKVDFSCTNAWIVNERNNTKYIAFKNLPREDALSNLLKQDFITMSSLIIRKSILGKLDYIFNSNYEIIGDFDLVLRLSIIGKFKSINEPLAYYRKHQKNLTHTKINLNISELSQLLDKIKKNKTIKTNKNFNVFYNNIIFNRVLMLILEKKRISALTEMLKIKRIIIFCKAFLILFLPAKIILKIRDFKNE